MQKWKDAKSDAKIERQKTKKAQMQKKQHLNVRLWRCLKQPPNAKMQKVTAKAQCKTECRKAKV